METTLTRYVQTPWPKLWATPVAEVTADDLLEVVACVVAAGKQRGPAKLRAFLRAAFAAGTSSRTVE